MKNIEHYVQIALFPEHILKKDMYDKFYSVFQFDFTKYHKLLEEEINKRELSSAYDLSFSERFELRKQCYILDEDNKKKSLSDCKHIFRYSALQSILEKLYLTHSYKFDIFDEKPVNWDGIIFYPDEQQAELEIFKDSDIASRITIHIALLRLLLTYEYSISECVSIINIMLLLLLKAYNAHFEKG